MMKTVKSILCVVALSMSVGAQAAKLTVKDCEDMQELAYKVMNLRQTGVPASQLIALADGNKIANAIVIAAYEELQYNTREYQIRANKEFANRVYIECFKSVTNK